MFITVSYAPVVDERVPGLGAWQYVVSGSFAVLLALSVLAHELGHTVVSLGLRLRVRRITLFLLGGVSEIEDEPQTPGREYLVAIAGPLVSLLLAGAGFAATAALQGGTVAHLLALQVALANGLVAVFNLLPGLPLDGGRVLRAAVWWARGDKLRGTRAAAQAGRGVAVLVVLGAVALSGGSLSGLTSVLFAGLVAAFIWAGATTSLRAADLTARLPQVTVGRLVRAAITVSADTPLAEAVRRVHEAGAGAVVVVDSDGRPDGIVDEAAVRATPAARHPWVTVGTLSRRVGPEGTLALSATGQDVVDRLRHHPASEYLVLDVDGRPVGVLATEDVVRTVDPRARPRPVRA